LFFVIGFYTYSGYGINESFSIEYLKLNVPCYTDPWKNNLVFSLWGVLFFTGIYLFYQVRKVIVSIRKHGPFEDPVLKQLKIIPTLLVINLLLYIITNFVIQFLANEVRIVLSTTTLVTLFLMSLVFVLVEIFKHGAKIHAEQKLTI